jgi:hypothetical protein
LGFLRFSEAFMRDLTEAEQAALSQWTSVAFDAAVLAGYVIPPWRPSLEAYEAFYEYFVFGFSPAEGAEAIFSVRH